MTPPGPTGPATVGTQNEGDMMRGAIMVGLAMKAMEQAIPKLGSQSEEGKAVLEALTKLAKSFGQASPDLSMAEAKMLGASAAPVQQPGPEQMDAFQKMIRQGTAQRFGPGMAAPAAAPPAV